MPLPVSFQKNALLHRLYAKQSFYCFGCGAGGDVITFIKRIENLETFEAIQLLAERAGLELPERQGDDHSARIKMRTLEINRETANFYFRTLLKGEDKRGLQYLANRKLSPTTIKKYGLGYAPAAWDALQTHLLSKGFRVEELLDAGVCRQKCQWACVRFFPQPRHVPDCRFCGETFIAFGGRILEDEPKRAEVLKLRGHTRVQEIGEPVFA